MAGRTKRGLLEMSGYGRHAASRSDRMLRKAPPDPGHLNSPATISVSTFSYEAPNETAIVSNRHDSTIQKGSLG